MRISDWSSDVCSSDLPFALSLVALRHLSAYSAQLAVNLEPVYAIALAVVLLGEQRELAPAFYFGVAIILIAVFAQPWLSGRHTAPAADMLATAEPKSAADCATLAGRLCGRSYTGLAARSEAQRDGKEWEGTS